MSSRIANHFRANVVGYLALFLALSGTAYALGTNTVKSRHIVNGQVKSVDVAPPENWHEVGAPGEPGFRSVPWTPNCFGSEEGSPWHNYDGAHNTAAFYRDPYGRVHLKGLVSGPECGNGTTIDDIFGLPAGYRPEKEIEFTTSSNGAFARLLVKPDGTVAADPPYHYASLYLDNISFRCAPAGQDGCP